MKLPEFLLDLAKASNQEIYLVGGAVRDLIKRIEMKDFDILCSKNAISFAKHLEEKNLAEIIAISEEFCTAKIKWKINEDKFVIMDLATARSEIYEYPGALPKIKFPVLIRKDIARRDFTINSIVIKLNRSKFYDPFKGMKDLRNRIIRVLHSKSYIDDPTRIIRAIRFAIKFDFDISPEDLKLIEQALADERIIGIIKEVRGIRVGIELKRLFEFDYVAKALYLMTKLNVWNICALNLKINMKNLFKHNEIKSWEIGLFCLFIDNDPSITFEIFEKLGFTSRVINQLKKILLLLDVSKIEISLKTYKIIESLEDEFKECLFLLQPQMKTIYNKMKISLPEISPEELINQGFKGKAISDELENIFKKNYASFNYNDEKPAFLE